MVMMRMWIRMKQQHKSMIDQHKMWRTESIVLESVKFGQYISDV
jgi:hypothetical protein